MPRDRQNIRFDQFVQPKRRGRKVMAWGVAGLAVAAVAAGAATYLHRNDPVPLATTPPPALSQAGGPVANEAYRWSAVAIGGGGFITGLAMDPAGKTFVARADVYGAYLWDSKANRWVQLVTAATMPAANRVQDGVATGAFEVAVSPSRPDRIYLAIKGQVYRSDDRGRSWIVASEGNPFPLTWDANSEWRLYGPFLAVDPDKPGTPHPAGPQRPAADVSADRSVGHAEVVGGLLLREPAPKSRRLVETYTWQNVLHRGLGAVRPGSALTMERPVMTSSIYLLTPIEGRETRHGSPRWRRDSVGARHARGLVCRRMCTERPSVHARKCRP